MASSRSLSLKRHLTFYGLMALTLLTACIVRRIDPPLVQRTRLIAFDTLQQWRPRTDDVASARVRIVDIDEASLKSRGQWPWPRTQLAELVTRLRDAGAAAIVFDMVFPEPDRTSPAQIANSLPATPEYKALRDALAARPSNDQLFADAIANAPTVLGFSGTTDPTVTTIPHAAAEIDHVGDDPRLYAPHYPAAVVSLAQLTTRAAGSGSFSWVPDYDQVIRRLPLFVVVGDKIYPSLVAESLRVAQGFSNDIIVASGAPGEQSFGRHTGIVKVQIGNVIVPTDAGGHIWLHFAPEDKSRYISAAKVLDAQVPDEEINGRIILVGTSATGLLDIKATPLNPAMPGVEAHAQAIEQIIAGDFLLRPDFATGLEITFVVVVGMALAVSILRTGAYVAFILGGAASAFVAAVCWLGYLRLGLLFDPTFPTLTLTAIFIIGTGYQHLRAEAERNRIRNAFGYYMAPAMVERLAADPSKLVLGGENRELTLLFADVRGFTRRAEGLDAQALTRFVIELFSPLSETILHFNGTIDKYFGDSVMAFWNAPVDQHDHAVNACRAALRMLEDVTTLNAMWDAQARAAGKEPSPVSVGIGINTGVCCVGNFGSERRFDYSVLGDAVNLASRLEGLNKVYGLPIIIGESTAKAAPELAVLEIDHVPVRGYENAVGIYALLGDETTRRTASFETLCNEQSRLLEALRARDGSKATLMLAHLRETQPQLAPLWAHYAEDIADWNAADAAAAE